MQDNSNKKGGVVENIQRPTSNKQTPPKSIQIVKFLCQNTANTAAQRNPPSEAKTDHVRLVTIGPSHYCEKVRWGFDLLEEQTNSTFYYTEEPHPPFFHTFFTVPLSKRTASMVPMVVFPDNRVMVDSTQILKQFCPFLYPDNAVPTAVDTMEELFDSKLGPAVRCLVYFHYFAANDNEPLAKLLTKFTVNPIETMLFHKILQRKDNPIQKGMLKAMNITQENAQLSEQILVDIFDQVSQTLETNGGDYLLYSDTITKTPSFTAADLTFAALASPIVMPKELLCFNDRGKSTPPHLLQLSNTLRNTRAGQHVLTMYHRHRFSFHANTTTKKIISCCIPKSPMSDLRVVIPKCASTKRVPWRIASSAAIMLGAVGAGVSMYSKRSKL